MQSRRTIALGVFCWAFCSAGLAQVATYRVTDIGDLPGANDYSRANGINNSGQVVGESVAATTQLSAILWKSGSGMQYLGNLSERGNMSLAYGVNYSGQVVGESVTADYHNRAFLWTSGSGMQDLGDLPGGDDYSVAYGINASGQVVGVSGAAAGGVAFFWTSSSGMQEIGYLPGTSGFSVAQDINVGGQVVGTSGPGMGARAFLWTSESGMQYLGDLPGGGVYSSAYGVNDSGQVVGWSGAAGGTRAFLWTSGSGMQDLGELPGGTNSSHATDINAGGQIVGFSDAVTGYRAFLWTNTEQMVDLNAHLDATGSGWTLQRAHGINDLGQVVGFGLNPSGVTHGFLLTPVLSPSSPVTFTASPPSGGNPIDPPLTSIDSRLSVDLPATNGGDFTATFREMTPAQAQMDLSSFNFAIPGETLQAWDLHFDGDLQGQSVTLKFHYDDAGMFSSLEQWLTVYHFVNEQAIPLTTISRDTMNNIITVSTDGFSTFALGSPQGLPEPSAFAMLGILGVCLGGYVWRKRRRARI